MVFMHAQCQVSLSLFLLPLSYRLTVHVYTIAKSKQSAFAETSLSNLSNGPIMCA